MIRAFTFFFTFWACGVAFGQYSTPGTGRSFSIAQLDALTDIISYDAQNNRYVLTENLTISDTDTFMANTDFTLAIAEGKEIIINGAILIYPPNQVHFTSTAPGTTYFRGITLGEMAIGNFQKFKMTYGGGMRVMASTFNFFNSEISYQNAGISTGAAINFSRGNPKIENSTFKFNDTPAVASAANSEVALEFINNYLEGNNQANSNRPQINMGPTGTDGVTIIRGNTIIGDRTKTRVGGISVSSLLAGQSNVLIENNTIRDNRYGITITAARATGTIYNNQILDNNTETNPNNGGSGINITSGETPNNYMINIVNNTIIGNLWGITKIGSSVNIKLENEAGYGQNKFADNGNNGMTYALYNNSPEPISARGNCWDPIYTRERVEEVIVHYNDDASLGEVDYTNYFECLLATENLAKEAGIAIYPNPSKGVFKVKVDEALDYQLIDFTGRMVQSGSLKKGENDVMIKQGKGTYIFKTPKASKKIIVQ